MRMSGQHIKTNRWIFSLMLIAFFWLVIGDLVTLHQKAIYGFDPFSVETPFTKTDNNHSSRTKVDKGSKFDKFKDQYHFDVLLNKQLDFKAPLVVSDFEFVYTFTVFISQSGYPIIALRGPPTV